MEPTSEQELKQLLDEGKITEDEYRELLEAIRQKEVVQKPVEATQPPVAPKPRTGYGKAALILMIVGFLLFLMPLIYNIILSTTLGSTPGSQARMKIMMMGCPVLFLSFLCELLAFIFGIIGWKTASGKIAAIGVPCLGFLIVPGLVFLMVFSHRAVSVAEGKVNEFPPLHDFVIHKHYTLDSTVGVLTQGGPQVDINIDYNNSADGRASLKITSDSAHKQVIHLFETGPIDVENRLLIYLAQLKSDFQKGGAYLEMWCQLPGKGEFFSRLPEQPISGKTNWTNFRTPFRLESGQSPANVKLNLVVEGIGSVWIDGVVLGSSPLHSSPDHIQIEHLGNGVHPVNEPLY